MSLTSPDARRSMNDATVLWVHAHPEPNSLNGALARSGMNHLRALGANVLESDLYGMDWQPVLDRRGLVPEGQRFQPARHIPTAVAEGRLPEDVMREQEKILRADAIVVQFPLWWYGMPAILKGWFDRVVVGGFAFGMDPATGRRLRFENGPFVGKRVFVVSTLGDRLEAISPRGRAGPLPEMLFGFLHGTLAYTGMSVMEPLPITSADFIDEAGFTDTTAVLARRLDGLFTDLPMPFRPQYQGDYTDKGELVSHVRPGETGVSVHLLTGEEATD